jgi:hypothetical protein
MNFAASYNQNGSAGSTIMQSPLYSNIVVNPNAYKLIDINIPLVNDVNSDDFKYIIQPPIGIPHLFDISSTGKVSVIDTVLSENTSYTSYLAIKSDKISALYNSAVTISDYMMTSREFSNQNLLTGVSTGLYIPTTVGRLFSDVNRNMKLDGGDVTLLFAQATGIDIPYTYTPQISINGINYIVIPTFDSNFYNNINKINPYDVGDMKFRFTTGAYGATTQYNLKYGFIGDVDLSYSSAQIIQTAAVKNVRIGTSRDATDVLVNVKNYTITSGNIEIPIELNTQSNLINGVQFEFRYDQNKIKFEELKSQKDLVTIRPTVADIGGGQLRRRHLHAGHA